jgi:Transcription factor WhiB
MNWQRDAACRRPGVHGDLWFPEKSDRVTERTAKRICRNDCPVRERCLTEALRTDDNDFGIRGGLTPAERRQLPRGRRAAA